MISARIVAEEYARLEMGRTEAVVTRVRLGQDHTTALALVKPMAPLLVFAIGLVWEGKWVVVADDLAAHEFSLFQGYEVKVP